MPKPYWKRSNHFQSQDHLDKYLWLRSLQLNAVCALCNKDFVTLVEEEIQSSNKYAHITQQFRENMDDLTTEEKMRKLDIKPGDIIHMHHTDPDEKTLEVTRMVYLNYPWDDIFTELDKTIPLYYKEHKALHKDPDLLRHVHEETTRRKAQGHHYYIQLSIC